MLQEVEGIDWGDAAVMNCKWKGPRIRDVLLRAGLRDEAADPDREMHVAFACYQVRCQDDDYFGSSVTLERCMREDGDAILALEVSLPLVYHFIERVVSVVLKEDIGERQSFEL